MIIIAKICKVCILASRSPVRKVVTQLVDPRNIFHLLMVRQTFSHAVLVREWNAVENRRSKVQLHNNTYNCTAAYLSKQKKLRMLEHILTLCLSYCVG